MKRFISKYWPLLSVLVLLRIAVACAPQTAPTEFCMVTVKYVSAVPGIELAEDVDLEFYRQKNLWNLYPDEEPTLEVVEGYNSHLASMGIGVELLAYAADPSNAQRAEVRQELKPYEWQSDEKCPETVLNYVGPHVTQDGWFVTETGGVQFQGLSFELPTTNDLEVESAESYSIDATFAPTDSVGTFSLPLGSDPAVFNVLESLPYERYYYDVQPSEGNIIVSGFLKRVEP